MTHRHGSRATLVRVTPGSHARPTDDPEPGPSRPRRPWGPWRFLTPVVVLLCGGLFIISAHNSHGTDLRPGRYTDLASLVGNEAAQYDALKKRVADLNAQVQTLTNSIQDGKVKRYQRKVELLKDPAGLQPQTGPGVTVTLRDAPEDVIRNTSLDRNLLVVHQQDIQAVVNAMWKSGATAVTVQGQRIVSTTGIKCEGNAVQLQGVPYSQPYRISAVGDQTALVNAIDSDSYLQIYRQQADDPRIQIGWSMTPQASVTAPAYDGLLDLSYAKPLKG